MKVDAYIDKFTVLDFKRHGGELIVQVEIEAIRYSAEGKGKVKKYKEKEWLTIGGNFKISNGEKRKVEKLEMLLLAKERK